MCLFYRESSSCTHISGLLHALVAVSRVPFQASVALSETNTEAAPLPVTSYTCQWKAPRKRKESSAKVSDVNFEKHVYGRVRKHVMNPIHDFDPRPPETRGTLSARLPDFLKKVKGKALGISIIADPSTQIWSGDTTVTTLDLPAKHQLEQGVTAFIQSLHVSAEKIREIERNTKDQHQSPHWFNARRYRLTASLFGEVLRRRPDTAPDSLVLRIIEPKQFTTPATDWGKKQELVALEQYKVHQKLKYIKSLWATQVLPCVELDL